MIPSRPGSYYAEPSPDGSAWYVCEDVLVRGQRCQAHRDTCKSEAAAVRMVAQLRAGTRRYNPSKGHTEPVRTKP